MVLRIEVTAEIETRLEMNWELYCTKGDHFTLCQFCMVVNPSKLCLCQVSFSTIIPKFLVPVHHFSYYYPMYTKIYISVIFWNLYVSDWDCI